MISVASIREIADAMGVHRVSAQRRAQKEGWEYQEQAVRGGKEKLYIIPQLPKPIQTLLAAKNAAGSIFPAISAGGEIAPIAPPPAMTPKMEEKMRYKAALLALYNRTLAATGWGDKVKARQEFESAYNSGLAWPQLFALLGPVSWKTIESWAIKTKRHHNDCFYLADRRGSHRRGLCGLTDEQSAIFLRCVLRPNKPRISESYRVAQAVMHQKGIANGHSEATYRRWLHRWKSTHYDVWVWAREGAKAWNDKCAFYIERDMNLLQVGDVIVADGHNLNFEIINPWTGKPTNHMALILFFDMRSNMPLGWEIMPTENTAAISSALRRAVLRLGKYPRVAYLDNGRAFKARFFSKSPDFDDAGYAGLYQRMGCQTIHAWPYHGQSKTVERLFGTFAELERLIPTYTGTSIENKPPRMMRGEKKHRRLHEQQFGDRCLTLEEAHILVASWFDAYAARPQRGHLDGSTPAELFEAGRGPGVDRAELTWLMMSAEVKTIHRNGITFRGQNYYHPALVGRRHAVRVHYDLQDASSLWVMGQDGVLICEATPVAKVHPAAAQLGTEADKDRLREHIEYKRSQEKAAVSTATDLLRLEVLPEHQRQMEAMGLQELPAGKPQPKAGKVLSLDYEKAMREAQDQLGRQDEIEARERHDGLMQLSEEDRYERLLELEAQGMELGPEWTGYMAYFERTTAYTDHREYWEGRRITNGLMYRSAAK